MSELSVLSPVGEVVAKNLEQPAGFSDLNLDQLVASLTTGREEYDLSSLYFRHLDDPAVIRYRQEVFADLEDKGTLSVVSTFATQLRGLRARAMQMDKLRHHHQRQGAVIDVVEGYCEAVAALELGLRDRALQGRALLGLRAHLACYVTSAGFRAMVEDTEAIRRRLWEVRYTVRIVGGRVHVARYADEADHSAEVLAFFERFKQGEAKEYRTAAWAGRELNRVEGLVLDLVARLHPEAFAALSDYCHQHVDFLDPTLRRFEREVQFYLAYLAYLAPLCDAGLPFCFPEITEGSKEVSARGPSTWC